MEVQDIATICKERNTDLVRPFQQKEHTRASDPLIKRGNMVNFQYFFSIKNIY